MNSELEKLVDIALIDGYITDKEREVLKRKAEALGFDLDELEMILNGRIYERLEHSRPKINKCPSCGEIISGFTRVCNSCDYVLNTTEIDDYETLEESFEALEEIIDDLKEHKLQPGSTPNFAANLKIFFTSGLYIIYKKLIKKENIYDSYRKVNKSTINKSNNEVAELRRKYGNNAQVNAAINSLIAERDSIIADRQKSDLRSGLINFAIWGAILGFFIYLGSAPPAPPTAEEKLQALIKENKISAAKAMLLELGENPKNSKDYYAGEIQLAEIDSLSGAGNYNEALRLANMLKNSDYKREREDKIDEIITKEVTELIAKKEFKQAKKRVELASYRINGTLKDQIKLAEEIK